VLTKNLQYLTALAQERHFARAAAACHVAQPTLSAGIKQLEDDLGVLIVKRGQRFEGFTVEGERILAWARRILADVDSLHEEVSSLKGRLVGRLRVGAIPTALPLVDGLTTPFARAFPAVSITITSLTSDEIQFGLDDFSLDAGITYLDNEPLARARGIALYDESYFLVTPANGPLGSLDRVGWAAAAMVPLCLLTPDMQNRRIINASFKAASVAVAAQVETNSVLAIMAHVRSGQWSSVVPQSFLSLLSEAGGVRAVPLVDPVVTHRVGLVVPDRDPLTPSALALVRVAETIRHEGTTA
jgi:DNA-binding transcriptional LysR family regulator